MFHGVMLQEHVQAQMSLVLSATFDMNQNFWRGVLNRRQVDYGFVYGLLGFGFETCRGHLRKDYRKLPGFNRHHESLRSLRIFDW